MNKNSEASTIRENALESAGHADSAREELIAEIVRSMRRMSPSRLKGIEILIKAPAGSRVFTPRSGHGMSLFNRLEGIDAVFSRCEQRVMRHATSMASFDRKIDLERRMFEINGVLVEVAAEMAIDFEAEDSSRDDAIIERIKELKRERQQGGEAARSSKRSKPMKDKMAAPAAVASAEPLPASADSPEPVDPA